MEISVRQQQDKAALTVGQPPRQYLTFTLNGEMYAVETLSVKEIIEYGAPTVVPMMPASVRGVINLRGAAVPVFDLGIRFNTGPTEAQRRSCIIIVESIDGEDGTGGHVFGLIVDAVNAVLEISAADIEPPPAFGASIRSDFIAGMGKVDGRFVILLEIGRVLSADELAATAS
ncbi:chemotaxis protein CheW [Azoarcus sp. TTM-91]|uniref:chemotaxis protein CheW n=1 Tax=Azoarcus sp. TTM-91 TaxID=2691581 RepID=UPI00145C4D66|nr:chemotaxis protein CheW [Azoarcus sp. TTM-91]NMG36953.1 chemotaxis protein CheW [Azoarcus sp. TTM-91]